MLLKSSHWPTEFTARRSPIYQIGCLFFDHKPPVGLHSDFAASFAVREYYVHIDHRFAAQTKMTHSRLATGIAVANCDLLYAQ